MRFAASLSVCWFVHKSCEKKKQKHIRKVCVCVRVHTFWAQSWMMFEYIAEICSLLSWPAPSPSLGAPRLLAGRFSPRFIPSREKHKKRKKREKKGQKHPFVFVFFVCSVCVRVLDEKSVSSTRHTSVVGRRKERRKKKGLFLFTSVRVSC